MLGAIYVLRHPRTGGYWFRRRVPNHLRTVIGRREITKTLGTKCLSEAKRLSRPYADATDALFDHALGRMGDGASSEPAAAIPSPTLSEGDRAWVDEFIKARVAGDQGIVVDAVTTVAPTATDSPPTALEAPTEAPTPSAPVTPEMTTVVATMPRLRVTTVQDMFERYISEFERRPRTERTWRTHLDMFLQISGLSWTTHVHKVTDAHVEDFILAMRKAIWRAG